MLTLPRRYAIKHMLRHYATPMPAVTICFSLLRITTPMPLDAAYAAYCHAFCFCVITRRHLLDAMLMQLLLMREMPCLRRRYYVLRYVITLDFRRRFDAAFASHASFRHDITPYADYFAAI